MNTTIAQITKALLFCILSLALCSCGGGSGGGSVPSSAAPSIATQPQSVTVVEGQPATFTVSANGTPSPAYQWTLDGTNISGATSASYTIATATLPQTGGSYAVVVSNSAGSITSTNATLTVNESSTSTTVTSISSTISSTTPTIVLPGVGTVDFTGQSGLQGQAVSLAQVVDSNLNGVATDQQSEFDTDLSDPNTLQIAVPIPPLVGVSVTVYATNAITTATASQIPTLYAYSAVGDSGDGENTFAALPATVDTTADTITVSVPGSFFQPGSDGTYVADLKIGVATASTSPASTSSQDIRKMISTANGSVSVATIPSNGTSVPDLPCPVSPLPPASPSPCTETSRFNPDRVLKGVTRPHYGMDLAASTETPIYVPSGGTLVSPSFTPANYAACLDNPTKSSCKSELTNSQLADMDCTSSPPDGACATINQRGGVTLTLQYSGFKLRLLHLSATDGIASCLLSGNPTDECNPVAMSGNTGAALTLGAHLHYEVWISTTKVCYYGGACADVKNRIDPFPRMATQLTFTETNKNTEVSAGEVYNFKLSATDDNGAPISSNVGKAGENGGNPPVFGPVTATFTYDPTRKVCLSPSTDGVLQFPTPDNITTFAGIAFAGSSSPSYCAPWGTTQIDTVNGLADSPGTTVTAKFSADATVPVLTDPLSKLSASWPPVLYGWSDSSGGSGFQFVSINALAGGQTPLAPTLTQVVAYAYGDQKYYYVDVAPSNNGLQLYSIDTSVSPITAKPIGGGLGSTPLDGLEFDEVSANLYGWIQPTSGPAQFAKIDTTTGVVTPVPQLTYSNTVNMAYAYGNQTYYYVDYNLSNGFQLYSINTAAGQFTKKLIGGLGTNVLYGLEFDAVSGNLYGWIQPTMGPGQFTSINSTTGAINTFGQTLFTDVGLGAYAYGDQTYFYVDFAPGNNGSQLYSIDTSVSPITAKPIGGGLGSTSLYGLEFGQ